MKRLTLLLLCTMSLPAHAILTCYISALGTNINWTVGNKFQGAYSQPDYCYANGAELAYIQQHFTGLPGRIGNSVDGSGYVTWTDPGQVDFLVNNL